MFIVYATTYSEALALCEMLAYQTGWLYWVHGDDPFLEGQYGRMFENMDVWTKQNPAEAEKRKQELLNIRMFGFY